MGKKTLEGWKSASKRHTNSRSNRKIVVQAGKPVQRYIFDCKVSHSSRTASEIAAWEGVDG
jgi:hypothetical protein